MGKQLLLVLILTIGLVEMTALAETKGGAPGRTGTVRCGRAHRRPWGSASHLCFGSFHGLRTRGPTVVGSHSFSHQKEINFLTAVSGVGQMSITMAKGMGPRLAQLWSGARPCQLSHGWGDYKVQ